VPWDVKIVVESVQLIGRLVIVHGASHTAVVFCFAAESQSKAFLQLQRLRASSHRLSLGVGIFIIYSHARLKMLIVSSIPVGLPFEKFIEKNCPYKDDDFE
jgi:pyruvate/2-oxoglutarate/acetoin dehydrogenase E1 component